MDFRSMYVVIQTTKVGYWTVPVAVCCWYDAAIKMAMLVNQCDETKARDFVVEVPVVRFEEAANDGR